MSPAPPDDQPGGLVQRTMAALNERLQRYEDKPLVDVGLRIYQRDRDISGTVAGSAIAFRMFLFFVPLLLFVVGISGFVSHLIDADDVNENAGLTGSLAAQIETALSQPTQTRWVAVGHRAVRHPQRRVLVEQGDGRGQRRRLAAPDSERKRRRSWSERSSG